MLKSRKIIVPLFIVLMSCVGCAKPIEAVDDSEDLNKAAADAIQTAETFLNHLRAENHIAAKSLTVGLTPFLGKSGKGTRQEFCADTWTGQLCQISSWDRLGWAIKIDRAYSISTENEKLRTFLEWEMRGRSGNLAILTYTLEYSEYAKSDATFDFVLRPTEQGWRIAESIRTVGGI